MSTYLSGIIRYKFVISKIFFINTYTCYLWGEALMAISTVQGYSSTYWYAKNLVLDFLTSFYNTFCGKHFFFYQFFKILVFYLPCFLSLKYPQQLKSVEFTVNAD